LLIFLEKKKTGQRQRASLFAPLMFLEEKHWGKDSDAVNVVALLI
jgi:hypothetical protein